jgi:hypothetical protein
MADSPQGLRHEIAAPDRVQGACLPRAMAPRHSCSHHCVLRLIDLTNPMVLSGARLMHDRFRRSYNLDIIDSTRGAVDHSGECLKERRKVSICRDNL